MKLSTAQIQNAMTQTGARPIPDDHPATQELKGLFGDHTFFLDNEGLEILETGEETSGAGGLANVVILARWANEERTALAPHEPEVTDITIELGPEEPGSAA